MVQSAVTHTVVINCLGYFSDIMYLICNVVLQKKKPLFYLFSSPKEDTCDNAFAHYKDLSLVLV